jgi:hypothetical protein
MRLVDDSITVAELRAVAEHTCGDVVKAVVDVRAGCMVVDADLHSDEEALLVARGLAQGNRSRGVDDPDVQRRIVAVVDSLVRP